MPFWLPGIAHAVAASDVGEGEVLAALRGRTGQRAILSGETMEVRGLLSMIAEEAGARPPSIRIPFAVAEAAALATEAIAWALGRRWALLPVQGLRMLRFSQPIDTLRAARELGMPRTPVRDAVRRAVAWYRAEGML
jgi:dihydroflavonol-4-reductase